MSIYAKRSSRIDPANLLPTASRSAIASAILRPVAVAETQVGVADESCAEAKDRFRALSSGRAASTAPQVEYRNSM
jgi:hypothetical protein